MGGRREAAGRSPPLGVAGVREEGGGLRGWVEEVELALDEGVDLAAPGGAVTVGLCGSWEHDGHCRWPHHSAITVTGTTWTVRVVFVAHDREVADVRRRIGASLASDDRWSVLRAGPVPLDAARGEPALAASLAGRRS